MAELSSYPPVTTLAGTERIPVITTPGIAGGNKYITADNLALAAKAGTAVSIADSAGYFTGTNAETVTAELGLSRSHLTVLNALDYGVIGDGTTDDSAAIMAFLALAGSGTPKCFYFPRGTYKLSTAITVPFIPRSAIVGDGPGITIFKPDSTIGGFRFRTDLTHGIICRGFSVNWATSQTTGASAAFHYGVTGGSAAGFFSHSYTDITIENAYCGWEVERADGAQLIWGSSWKNIRLYDTKSDGFYFAPATPTGVPELSFDHIFIENANVTSTGNAFTFVGVEASMTNIGVEWWDTRVFDISAGGHTTIKGFHLEHHSFSEAFSYLAYIGVDTMFSMQGFQIQGATTAGCTDMIILFARNGAGGFISIADGVINVDTTLGSAYVVELLWANNGVAESYNVRNVRKSAGGINMPFSGSRGLQTEASLIQLGMLATSARMGVATPLLRLGHIEALPAASLVYHGEIRFVKGGAGVLDRLVVCRKDAADAYAWADLF